MLRWRDAEVHRHTSDTEREGRDGCQRITHVADRCLEPAHPSTREGDASGERLTRTPLTRITGTRLDLNRDPSRLLHIVLKLIQKYRLPHPAKPKEHEATVVAPPSALRDHQVDEFDLRSPPRQLGWPDSGTRTKRIEKWIHVTDSRKIFPSLGNSLENGETPTQSCPVREPGQGSAPAGRVSKAWIGHDSTKRRGRLVPLRAVHPGDGLARIAAPAESIPTGRTGE